jgi:hypothetical protein
MEMAFGTAKVGTAKVCQSITSSILAQLGQLKSLFVFILKRK